jgi:hypothetical protein
VKSYLGKDPTGMKYEGYQLLNDGMLTYKGRLYVPNSDYLKRFILDEVIKYHTLVTLVIKKLSQPLRTYFIG